MAKPEGRSIELPGGRALEALQRVTDAALAYLSEEDLLEELLRRISDIMEIDTVAILLLEGEALHARAAKGIEEEVEQGVRIPLGRGFAGRIAAERRAITIPDVDHADILNPILREKGIKSLLGVPLIVQGTVLGVLHVGSLTPRDFTDDDRDLLQLAADRAALAIEQARLYGRERLARIAAERAALRLQSLQRVTDAALAYLSEEDLLEELLRRISDIMEIDTVAILLLEGEALHARAAKGIEEEVEQGVRIPLGRGFAGRIAAERRAITIPDVDHADILNPILREKGIKSLLGVPLIVQGTVLGVLHVGSLTPRDFTDDDRDLLQLAADRAALAIEQARLHEQRRVAETMQRRLLPDRLSDVSGLETAARYLPAAGGSLGGDWYDVFSLAGGRVAVAVGDVVGRGVEAAAVMAQLRTAVRAYAADGHPPAAVLERVNTLMWHLGPLSMTTALYAVLDPAAETLELVSAGHPPALIIPPSGAAAYIESQPGLPLGVSPMSTHASQTVPPAHGRHPAALHRRTRRAPGRVDRLRSRAAPRARRGVQRPGGPLRVGRRAPRWRGAERRRRVRRRARPAVDGPPDAQLAGDGGEPGRHPVPAAPLAREPRRRRRGDLRHRRRMPGGVRERRRACVRPRARARRARARRHLCGRPGQRDRLRSRLLAAVAQREPRSRPPDDACAHGHGRRPPARRRHRRRPGQAPRDGDGVTLLVHITDERHGDLAVARVDGEIDASNVKWVETRLRTLLTNQSVGLVVDLSATTYLDSAGIALWFALAEDLRQHQQQLRLVVVERSSIARMVTLTGLDEAVPTHPTLEQALNDEDRP